MTRYLIPSLLGLIAVALFVTAIDPLYKEVGSVRIEVGNLNEALANSKQIVDVRDALLERFNAVSPELRDRIKKMIPDNVDNVRLILELDGIASRYGVAIKDIALTDDVRRQAGALGPDENIYGTIGLRVTVTGTYESFLKFLRDVEESLRIVDISALSFRSTGRDFNQYDLDIKTYWLR